MAKSRVVETLEMVVSVNHRAKMQGGENEQERGGAHMQSGAGEWLTEWNEGAVHEHKDWEKRVRI